MSGVDFKDSTRVISTFPNKTSVSLDPTDWNDPVGCQFTSRTHYGVHKLELRTEVSLRNVFPANWKGGGDILVLAG